MIKDLQENRYPYNDVINFFFDGFWLMPEAVHMVLAWVFVLVLILGLFLRTSGGVIFKSSILYFALVEYNNPAFDYFGIKLNEYFGIIAFLGIAFKLLSTNKRLNFFSPVVLGLAILFIFSIFHAVTIGIAYPVLNLSVENWITKLAINFKILVLAANLYIVGINVRQLDRFDCLIKTIVLFGAMATLIYLVQVTIILGGTIPFGTYIDAGFIGVPSFGATSIERGHFGKAMAPLAPFFLYALIAYKWRLTFALFALVSAINLSASSLSFFAFFCLLSAWVFRRELFIFRNAPLLFLVALIFLLSIYWFYDVYEGVFIKIYDLALSGEQDAGGRTTAVMVEYLEAYPFGLGYSGSILRTPYGLPEINSGVYAFIVQFSFLAPIVMLGLCFLVYRTISRLKLLKLVNPDMRSFGVGVILSILIFFSDILWFVPTIWLSYELLWSAYPSSKSTSIQVQDQVDGGAAS